VLDFEVIPLLDWFISEESPSVRRKDWNKGINAARIREKGTTGSVRNS
jgi:hypothetical protein